MKKIAAIFPGQGSQAAGMGKSLIATDQGREMAEEASGALGYDIAALLDDPDRLSQTEFTQPAILFVSLAAYKLFESELPIKPVFALGHSLGELTALAAMGALPLAEAVKIAAFRGAEMKKACEGKGAGMMVTLGLSDEAAEKLCADARSAGKQVWAANYNCDGQIVIAGLRADLETQVEVAKAAGAKRAMLLDMSVASHCPILAPAQEPLKKALAEKMSDTFLSPIVSNATAAKYRSKAEAIALLADQLVKPVLYKKSVAAFENEADIFVEFGHGAILKGLNKKITQKETLAIANTEELATAVEVLERSE
ncbi:MAG: ACP S-malonyltransferase [Helicobacteraceae bacterium]|jgi:[acyl-carrier-protein] S-malonyltransferase|nr:ACP S-malonyltransferase [Helicobacteraceae bacterium]